MRVADPAPEIEVLRSSGLGVREDADEAGEDGTQEGREGLRLLAKGAKLVESGEEGFPVRPLAFEGD